MGKSIQALPRRRRLGRSNDATKLDESSWPDDAHTERPTGRSCPGPLADPRPQGVPSNTCRKTLVIRLAPPLWFWNQSTHLKLEIEVCYDGEVRANLETGVDPPAHRSPMPANWADSTAIFQAAPAFSESTVDIALTNLGGWPDGSQSAFWVIGCIATQKCPVYYVR
jgi:hypothetical protein